MPLKNIPLTKKDFEKLLWEDIVKKSDKKECFNYSPLFFAKAQEAKVSGEEKAEEIFILLGGITSMMLKESSPSEPFAPMFTHPEYRSAVIDDFCDNHLSVLSEIVFDIFDPEIRARIADILWIKKGNFRMAELAIKSYFLGLLSCRACTHESDLPSEVFELEKTKSKWSVKK